MTTTVTIKTDEGDKQGEFEIVVGEVAQKHVLRSFNPERDQGVAAKVDGTKVLCAALIQQMIDLRDGNQEATEAQKRGASIAITLIEGAQMAAVKANFAQA